ncbi:MAG: alpha/beta hydrolase [Hyphomicrobiales bacterium]|nr:alpha/beta hydrolase [Hyphomicrobiales bacterium]
MDFLKWLVIAAVGIYAVIVAAMYVGQRGLVFPRRPERSAPAQAGFPEAQEHILTTQDGERLVTWLRPPAGDKNPLFLMFLGNGDNLGIIAPRLRQMTEDGSGVLAVAYRGYSGSTGSPSETGLSYDAEAAYRFATTVVSANRIVLFGYSLGSGVAVPLAVRHETAALVLFAPFSSAVAVAAAVYPWLPVRFLMKDQFRSMEVVGKIKVPILVVHGERDDVVPISFGRELYAAVAGPKRFVALPQADHFSLFENGGVRVIRSFLDEFGLR